MIGAFAFVCFPLNFSNSVEVMNGDVGQLGEPVLGTIRVAIPILAATKTFEVAASSRAAPLSSSSRNGSQVKE